MSPRGGSVSPNRRGCNLFPHNAITVTAVLASTLFTLFFTFYSIASVTPPPRTVSLAWIGPTESNVARSFAFGSLYPGPTTQAGFQAAIKMINDDPHLLPNTTLVGLINSSGSDPGVTAGVTAQLLDQRADVVGIVGEFTVPYVQQVQYIARHYQVPQCTPYAVSMDLSLGHASQFPYLARMVHSGVDHVLFFLPLVRALGYHRIAVAYATDPFGSPGGNAIVEAAPNHNITVLQSVSFDSTGLTSDQLTPNFFDDQIKLLVASGARIFTFVSAPLDFPPFFKAAALAGLVGEGYLWILPFSLSLLFTVFTVNGVVDPVMVKLLEGSIGIVFTSDEEPTYTTNTTLEERTHAEMQYSTYRSMWNGSQLFPEMSGFYIPGSPFYQTDLAYDCTLALARALHKSIYDRGLDPTLQTNRDVLMTDLLEDHFRGVSGDVSFNDVGDRRMGVRVRNFQNGEWKSIGHITTEGEVTLELEQIKWPGGEGLIGGLKPFDHVPSLYEALFSIQSGYAIASLTLCGVGLLLTLLLLPFLYLFWHHPVLKAASPTFLVLTIIGVQCLCASIIPRVLENGDITSYAQTTEMCTIELFLINLGYVLLVSSLLVKTYRLNRIYSMTDLNSTFKLRDNFLLLVVGIIMSIEVGILLTLLSFVPLEMNSTTMNTFGDHQTIYLVCGTHDDAYNTVYQPVLLTVRFALIGVTTLYAYLCRKVPSVFNESTLLLSSMYNLCFVSILLPAIDEGLGRGRDLTLLLYSISIFIICVLTLALLFVPKLIWIVQIAKGTFRPNKSRAHSEQPSHNNEEIKITHVKNKCRVTADNETFTAARNKELSAVASPTQRQEAVASPRRTVAVNPPIPEYSFNIADDDGCDSDSPDYDRGMDGIIVQCPSPNMQTYIPHMPPPIMVEHIRQTPTSIDVTPPDDRSISASSSSPSPSCCSSSPPASSGPSLFTLILRIFGDRLSPDTLRELYLARIAPQIENIFAPPMTQPTKQKCNYMRATPTYAQFPRDLSVHPSSAAPLTLPLAAYIGSNPGVASPSTSRSASSGPADTPTPSTSPSPIRMTRTVRYH